MRIPASIPLEKSEDLFETIRGTNIPAVKNAIGFLYSNQSL